MTQGSAGQDPIGGQERGAVAPGTQVTAGWPAPALRAAPSPGAWTPGLGAL